MFAGGITPRHETCCSAGAVSVKFGATVKTTFALSRVKR